MVTVFFQLAHNGFRINALTAVVVRQGSLHGLLCHCLLYTSEGRLYGPDPMFVYPGDPQHLEPVRRVLVRQRALQGLHDAGCIAAGPGVVVGVAGVDEHRVRSVEPALLFPCLLYTSRCV